MDWPTIHSLTHTDHSFLNTGLPKPPTSPLSLSAASTRSCKALYHCTFSLFFYYLCSSHTHQASNSALLSWTPCPHSFYFYSHQSILYRGNEHEVELIILWVTSCRHLSPANLSDISVPISNLTSWICLSLCEIERIEYTPTQTRTF